MKKMICENCEAEIDHVIMTQSRDVSIDWYENEDENKEMEDGDIDTSFRCPECLMSLS